MAVLPQLDDSDQAGEAGQNADHAEQPRQQRRAVLPFFEPDLTIEWSGARVANVRQALESEVGPPDRV